MTIGNRITKLRLKNCMSLRDFGNVLGVADTTVLRWENNDARIAFEDAIKMCERFRVSLNWLAGLEEMKKND
ncbi:helix-turn-helix domain-containing protein [Blautia massiliensis (ex Durand et al. 2017)]|uniref:helix-turn-helix domain-containing protein n=1 Tax=Blautia massiliensis (ex Durand et al. 2017) TaxID=1737424 RepID=UPI001570058C|nr:helix-turn-helix transcriptional regulator [Blautia massiliensis (ex Durand et al. 2017)]NSK76043.1 helix-turn-helix transcriptional regulator [Blautia massiliensis (ex Durand et al. 2017)]